MKPAHIDVIARALADTADDGCFDNPPTYDDEGFLDLDVDLNEWNSGEEDREHWTKLAHASVSKLTDAGYSIVESIRVGSRVHVSGNLGTVQSVHGDFCIVDFGDAGVYPNRITDCTIAAAEGDTHG
ncbi:hypothetical protein [Rhodococcoides fascians]|uniref:hypothetical protein n=1 Tax=Rhodococcoides fascians TaxID=1828 RepID=UPI00050CF470|nr:hypothetical protein [Rhodococcus fascians]